MFMFSGHFLVFVIIKITQVNGNFRNASYFLSEYVSCQVNSTVKVFTIVSL